MKKLNTLYILIFFLIFSFKSFGVTWNVNVADFSFNPPTLPNVHVGDTVKWQWLNGIHTTTSLTIPAGALPWDSPLSSSNQTFRYVVTVAGNYNYQCTPHAPSMAGSFVANVIGITPIHGEVPQSFKLHQNYPNPFNPVTDIKFDVPASSFVKLTVYSILGNEVEVLVNEQMNAGSYNVDWDASNYPSGVYIYKMVSGNFIETKKMILIK